MITALTSPNDAALLAGINRPNVPDAPVGARGGEEEAAAARRTARQFIGEVFFGQLLKELRKSTSNDHLLHGGRGEETLRPYLDQVLVRRLAASRHFELADAVADRLCRKAADGSAAVGAGGELSIKEMP